MKKSKQSQSIDSHHFLLDIDECLSHNCTGVHEICANTIGSFECICMPGYRRDTNGNCLSKNIDSSVIVIIFVDLDINECAESTTACDVNSRCEDRNGSYACCLSTITSECIGKYIHHPTKLDLRNICLFIRMWV